jgi:hypothetical protein
MNTNPDRHTTRVTGSVRARRVATLSVAGVLAALALAPTSALADHPTSEGGGTATTPSGDKWNYMYETTLRREARAQDRVTNAGHPTSEGGGTATTPSGAKWNYMYETTLRREARDANADPARSDASGTATGYVNPWSYLYDVDQRDEQEVRNHVPPGKTRHDSLLQRKAHPALARIMVSVTRSAPASCYVPDTVDPETRRLIAVQLCGSAHIVPAVFLDRAADYEPAYSLGNL